MKRIKGAILLLSFFWAILSLPGELSAQAPPSPPLPSPSPPTGPSFGPPPGSPPFPPPVLDPFLGPSAPSVPIEKISPGVFRLGEVMIHKDTRSISFPAQINLTRGLLEYLIVRSSGKVHESLLRTSVDPFQLQIAFLLLGFEGTDRPLAHQGAPDTPRGEPVEISFIAARGTTGEKMVVKPEQWIAHWTGHQYRDVGPLNWVYRGSLVMDGRFLA